jgi:hypothetical protein
MGFPPSGNAFIGTYSTHFLSSLELELRHARIPLEIERSRVGAGMVAHGQNNGPSESSLTPRRAVLIGQLVVNLPVVCIIGSAFLLAYLLKGPIWAPFGLLLGIIPGWVWWSFMVPRWREWAKRRGADEIETQLIGERSGLVWPEGSFFERTEFGSRNKPVAERQIKRGSAKKSATTNYWPALLFVGGIYFASFGVSAFRYSRWDHAHNALVHPVYHPWAIVVGLLMACLAYWARDTAD